MLRWLWLSLLVIALDLATKQLASTHLVYGEPVALLPVLNLTLMHNTGAAFSFLGEAGGWQRWLFTAVSLLVSVAIVVWIRRLQPGQHWLALALALVLGGALGNVWDRITLGHVVDFIDVYYRHWHWPAFNVADIAISLGAVMLLIDGFRPQRNS